MANRLTDRAGETDEARDKAAERWERQHPKSDHPKAGCTKDCVQCKEQKEKQMDLFTKTLPD